MAINRDDAVTKLPPVEERFFTLGYQALCLSFERRRPQFANRLASGAPARKTQRLSQFTT